GDPTFRHRHGCADKPLWRFAVTGFTRPNEVAFLHEASDRCDQLVEKHLGGTVVQINNNLVPVHKGLVAKANGLPELVLQLPFRKVSESMGNHDSKIVGADSVD